VQVARGEPALLLEEGEEGDDVVLRRALDLVDARDVGGPELEAGEGLLELGEVGLGHLAERDHRLAGGELDVEPDAEAALGGPDAGHLRARVARDHVNLRLRATAPSNRTRPGR